MAYRRRLFAPWCSSLTMQRPMGFYVRVLFWNVGKKGDRVDLVADAVAQHAVELVILAEFGEAGEEHRLLVALNERGPDTFTPVNPVQTRIRMYTSWPTEHIEAIEDVWTWSVRRIIPPIGLPHLLVAVHLPSKLNMNEAEQAMLVPRLAEAIRRAENDEGHERTVLVGDLNMNPFEAGVVASETLRAVMDRTIAERGFRTVHQERRPFFYNPMWSRLGDRSAGPPGTLYYDHSGVLELFWNTFDQVLVRPALLPYFDDASLQVLTRIGERNLLRADGTPDPGVGSDHLPLMFDLTTDRQVAR